MLKNGLLALLTTIVSVLLAVCSHSPNNNPYKKADDNKNIYYSAFAEQPKTLDPARSYSANEATFTANIYEPPLEYQYLTRPFTLQPLTASSMPSVVYYDKNNHKLPTNAPDSKVAKSVYTITIKPDIYYQPHPAFAKNKNGQYRYHQLQEKDLINIHTLSDFKYTGTRNLKADDYVYQIKRLASPQAQSPILGLMQGYIPGLAKLANQLKSKKFNNASFIDLRKYPLDDVKTLGPYTYQITLHGKYPQFIYWLAMPFFAPIPWEADKFYHQPGMSARNISFAWYPVGTGPFMLSENNPNSRMVMVKNPNFHADFYPTQGTAQDRQAGLLKYAGEKLPLVDRFVFTLEKESIPRWNKFLQGYYDASGIGADNFDEAINFGPSGKAMLTDVMQQKNIQLQTEYAPSIFYLGFNMLDKDIGGYSEKQKKLRQAISTAVDMEEFISIFLNGRGEVAQGPIPPGIFGHVEGKAGINPYIYDWQYNHPKRKSLTYARKLMKEAGYPNGINEKTGKPLSLNFDTVVSGSDDRSRFDWLRKQFAKLGIQLHIRATQYNRFQEKLRTGNAQIFFFGWNADYPDPENFLFLLYGPNGKVKHHGENATNYQNKEFDSLFTRMKSLPNSDERQALINQMVNIIRQDSPWIWGFYPQSFSLSQSWVAPTKINPIANNTLKYIKLSPEKRADLRLKWNQPTYWPIILILLCLIVGLIPVIISFRLKAKRQASREK